MRDGRHSILVIKLSSIGDCIHCSAAVRRLREARPDDYIVWLVEPKSQAVVVGTPHADEVIVYQRAARPIHSLRGFIELCRLLAPYRFDTSIDFQGLARSARIAIASGAHNRIAFQGSREASAVAATCAWSTRTNRQWTVHRYMELLEPLGIPFQDAPCFVPITAESEAEAEGRLHEEGLDGAPFLALAIRGSWPSKFWPTERFAQVARYAHERWVLAAAVLGGPADHPHAERLEALAGSPIANLCGRLSLGASIAAVRRSAALIGPDTGLLYAAMALRVPTVSLFGPTDPELVAPRGERARTVYTPMPCSPCNRKPRCRHYDCMLAIRTEEVIEALEGVLAPEPVGAPVR